MSFEELYQDAVTDMVRGELSSRVAKFIELEYDDERPTILVIPGGMGSQLMATDSVLELPLEGRFPRASRIWIGLPELIRMYQGDYTFLKLDPKLNDEAQHAVYPNGAMGADIGPLERKFSPYFAISKFSKDWANYLEFGYDWRKPARIAAQDLRWFLNQLRRHAKAQGKANPLARLTLLAHSQGGHVVGIFLHELERSGESANAWFDYVVSVAAPYYGCVDHINRYFAGPLRNIEKFIVTSIMLSRCRVHGDEGRAWSESISRYRELAASFAGLFHLCPAPRSILHDRVLERLNLDRYPVRDSETGGDYDFLSKTSNWPWVRKYATTMRRMTVKRDFKAMNAFLPDEYAERYFFARAYRKKTGKAHELVMQPPKELPEKLGGARPLKQYLDHFSPFDALDPDAEGEHDGVVAKWAAVPVWVPSSQILDILGTDHRMSAGEQPFLERLKHLMESGSWFGEVQCDGTANSEGDLELDRKFSPQGDPNATLERLVKYAIAE